MSANLPPFITLRHHQHARINVNDFNALKRFEAEHPQLYAHFGSSGGPRPLGNYLDAAVQGNAFNKVFDHPHWGAEFKRLLKQGRS